MSEWKKAPVDPTPEMTKAGAARFNKIMDWSGDGEYDFNDAIELTWKEMITMAPAAEWKPTHRHAEGGEYLYQGYGRAMIASGDWQPAVFYMGRNGERYATSPARWGKRFEALDDERPVAEPAAAPAAPRSKSERFFAEHDATPTDEKPGLDFMGMTPEKAAFIRDAGRERLADAPAAPRDVTCPACKGSGERTYLSGGGPDAYDESGDCDRCGGTGALDAAPEAPVAQPDDVKQILDTFDDDQRITLFRNYCLGCGSKDPGCFCRHDD